MEWVEATIEGAGGLSLSTRRSEVPEARARIVMVHGYGEYCDRYAELTADLNARGFSCYLFDLRGHGRSDGARGTIRRWDEYLDDLARFIDRVREWSGHEPEVLFGHSLGGLIAASYALRREHAFRHLVLSAPFFGLAIPVPPAKLILAKIMSRVYPGLCLATEIDPFLLTHDRDICTLYRDDPLVHKVANARFLTEVLAAQADCLERADRLSAQGFLLMYGTDDRLVSVEANEAFFAKVRIEDREIIPYEGMYHEIFNEIDRSRVYDDLGRWLMARFGGDRPEN
ncbi:MAG: lysophospholipase [Proteobacteria bacterium]|nr:lysophospholipase [Pseudomonadota bacterium]